MRKPSVFSRDYEKRMKKRRKVLAAIYILVFLMLGFIAAMITTKSYDFTNLRNRIQTWIDSGNNADNEKAEENVENTEQEQIEEPKVEEKNIEIRLGDNRLIVCEYEEKDGKVYYKGIKNAPEGLEVSLSPNKESLLLVDEKQNIKIFNTKGEETDLTKGSYTAPDGEVFNKDKILETYQEYFWSKEAKFINDEKIAYVSNVPYFGYDLNKYIWIIDIKSKEHKTLWNSKGKDVKLLDIKEKGLEISIDNNVKYLDNNGNIIN